MALIHFLKLDDNAASTTISATVGPDAVLLGGANTNDKHVVGPNEQISSALSFNGSTDYIDISNLAISFFAGEPFTFSFWAKTNETIANWFCEIDFTTRAIRKANNVSIIVDNTPYIVSSIGTSSWHHYLVSRNTSNVVRVFMDAVEAVSGPQTEGSRISPDSIGIRNDTYYNGSMAWIKIFDTDESSQVYSLYTENVIEGLESDRWTYSKEIDNYYSNVKAVNTWAKLDRI